MSDILNSVTVFVSNNLLIVVAVLIVFAYLCSKQVEKFNGFSTTILTEAEYKQEVRVLAAYIGDYLSDIFVLLRAKYAKPETGEFLPPLFQPGGINDPTLSDPALSVYRGHIKSFLGSAKIRIVQKYGQAFLAKYKPLYDLDYEQAENHVLTIRYTMDGETQTFYV